MEPIFLKKREGHARCVVCHAGAANGFHLQPLAPGATTWTEEQSRQNFEAVSKLVRAANLMSSPILKHPLAQEAGGDDFHSGGRQFTSQSDPDWKAIEDWARGAQRSKDAIIKFGPSPPDISYLLLRPSAAGRLPARAPSTSSPSCTSTICTTACSRIPMASEASRTWPPCSSGNEPPPTHRLR